MGKDGGEEREKERERGREEEKEGEGEGREGQTDQSVVEMTSPSVISEG